jgi:hypothetical protein
MLPPEIVRYSDGRKVSRRLLGIRTVSETGLKGWAARTGHGQVNKCKNSCNRFDVQAKVAAPEGTATLVLGNFLKLG